MHEQHRQRLRARFEKTGLDGFADHEVLELLLTYAIPRRDVNPIAHALLDRFGSISAVLEADSDQLCAVEGIGPVSATFFSLLGQLQQRLILERAKDSRGDTYLQTPLQAAQFVHTLLHRKPTETVYAVLLDKNHRVIHHQLLQTGSLTETAVYPRQLAELALRKNAYSLLLAHNHPSGDPTPSSMDAALTAGAKAALAAVDVRFPDHMIVGEQIVYSFFSSSFLHLITGETFSHQQWKQRHPLSGGSEKAHVSLAAEPQPGAANILRETDRLPKEQDRDFFHSFWEEEN